MAPSKQKGGMKINFNKTEWQILNHRLEVDDALSEALGIDPDLARQVCKGLLNNHNDIDPTPLQLEILRDCVEGSTFFGAIDDPSLTSIERARYFKAAYSLEEKLEVNCPLY